MIDLPSHHLPKAGVAQRLSRHLHKAIFFVIPMILTLRLVSYNGKHWQQQMMFEPLPMDCGNCSGCPTAQLLPASKVVFKENTTVKRVKSSDDPDSLDAILKSLQAANAELLLSGTQEWSPIRTRSFPRRNASFPCHKPDDDWKAYATVQRTPVQRGFFYVKTFKTASTTVMGITIRIALKSAERQLKRRADNVIKPCKVRFEHWPAYRMGYRQRKRDMSFLFAVLREPTQRAISMFFHFEVSRDHKQPLDSNFVQFLTAKHEQDPLYPDYYPWAWSYDHYLHYLAVEGYRPGSETKAVSRRIQTVNKILKDYDFIGITERLDESLVALQMILRLKTSDILYYSAKGNGSWDDHGVYIQPSFVSQGMKKFFASEKWKDLSRGDYLMYLAANATLDRTIDRLGRDEFEKKLALFRHAKELVTSNCTEIRPLFSAAGKAWYNDCLLADAGCGNQCFDKLERDFGI